MNTPIPKAKASLRSNLFVLGIVLVSLFSLSELCLSLIKPTSPKQLVTNREWVQVPERIWTQRDDYLGWTHQKGVHANLQLKDQIIPITTNSIGLRGKQEYDINSSLKSKRLYVVGDSFTFGFGVRDEEVYTRQIELLDDQYEALNFGVAAYGIDQMYLRIKQFGFEYKPDTLLIAIFPEDFWRSTRAYTDAGYGKPYFKMSSGKLTLENAPKRNARGFIIPQFPAVIDRGILGNLLYRSQVVRLLDRSWAKLMKILNLEDPDSSLEWRLGREILKMAINEFRGQVDQIAIVIIPPKRWVTGTVEPIRDSIKAFCERQQIDYIDLTPDFREAVTTQNVDQYYIQGDGHWTAAGHHLAAEIILKSLKETSIPPNLKN